MIIKNGNVFQEDGSYKVTDLYIENGRLVASEEEVTDKTELDAAGLKVLPGLVDIHSHGAVRHDFSDADVDGLKVILQYERSQGVTSYCPTSMTLPKEELLKIFQTAKDVDQDETCARIVGINMEGPFLDPAKKGAHVEGYIRKPDIEFFRECNEAAGGLIKLVDIAPEEKGAMDFIEQCHEQVKISIAHTCCNYETACEALEKGVSHMTHLYNAMPGINHRNPGPIIAALEAGAEVELIADGIHIHPAIVRMTFRIFGADKVILISDSMEATGLLDGDYQLGGQGVTVKGRKAILTEKPDVIAGSVTNLLDCMRNCVQNMGIPLEDAVLAATENPAKSIGVEKDYGKIAVGNYGNLLLLDKELRIKNIVQKGKMVKPKHQDAGIS